MEAPTLSPPPAPAADRSPSPPRGVGARLGRSSAVYAGCGFANKAIGFTLLPIYTHVLSAEQYGTVAAVTLTASVLTVLFALAMGTAVMRFYHEHRDQPAELAAFLGTILTAVFAASLGASVLLLLGGQGLFEWLLVDVTFWPAMALGLGVAALQPSIDVYLIVLQTAERPRLFAVLAVSMALARAVLAIVLVVGVGLGATGVLAAHLASVVLVFAFCLLTVRGQARLGIRPQHLRRAARYALPILPHTLASLVKQVLDRMLLLHLIGKGAVGVYHIGFQFGALTQLAAASCSRALNPIFMRALAEDDAARLANIRNLAVTMVLGYTWFSLGVSLFAPEIVFWLTGPEFHASYRVVPFLTFTFVATGIYSLLVNVVLFRERTSRYLAVCTVGSLVAGVGLSLWWIPRWGLCGAGAATLVTQVAFTAVVGVLGHRHGGVHWPYGRFAAMFGLGFALALWPLAPAHEISLGGAALKLGMALVALPLLSIVGYGSPLFLVRELRQRCRSGRHGT